MSKVETFERFRKISNTKNKHDESITQLIKTSVYVYKPTIGFVRSDKKVLC